MISDLNSTKVISANTLLRTASVQHVHQKWELHHVLLANNKTMTIIKQERNGYYLVDQEPTTKEYDANIVESDKGFVKHTANTIRETQGFCLPVRLSEEMSQLIVSWR